MKFIVAISILLFALTACETISPPNESQITFNRDQSIIIDDLERRYHIQIPQDPAGKPLVILLHGHGGSFDQSLGLESTKNPQRLWLETAEEEDFTLVAPNGVLGPEDTRGWNDCRSDAVGNPDTDDVKFISELLDQLAAELNFDQQRVYVCGISNGASMAIRLVQEIPDRIAAFSAIVKTMPVNSMCPSSEVPVSALFMNGTEDIIAPYNGGQILGNRGLVQSTDESITYWVERNGTESEPETFSFPDLDTDDNSTVEKFTYRNGENNTEVVLVRVNGGGHTEPSLVEKYSQLYLNLTGEQNHDIEMVTEVWSFFKPKSK